MKKKISFYYEKKTGFQIYRIYQTIIFNAPEGLTDKEIVHNAYLIDISYKLPSLQIISTKILKN